MPELRGKPTAVVAIDGEIVFFIDSDEAEAYAASDGGVFAPIPDEVVVPEIDPDEEMTFEKE